MGRRGKEFPKRLKIEAKRRVGYKCERCGEQFRSQDLVCHHILMIRFAKLYPEISNAVISSMANLKILCSNCHKIEDRIAMRDHAKAARRLNGRNKQRRLF